MTCHFGYHFPPGPVQHRGVIHTIYVHTTITSSAYIDFDKRLRPFSLAIGNGWGLAVCFVHGQVARFSKVRIRNTNMTGTRS